MYRVFSCCLGVCDSQKVLLLACVAVQFNFWHFIVFLTLSFRGSSTRIHCKPLLGGISIRVVDNANQPGVLMPSQSAQLRSNASPYELANFFVRVAKTAIPGSDPANL
jgi:hypothetical protein